LSPNTVARKGRRPRYGFEIALFGIKGRAGVMAMAENVGGIEV